MDLQSALETKQHSSDGSEHESRSELAAFGEVRSVSKRTAGHEALARKQLEVYRETPYSDEEWADAKSRFLALARLIHRWVKAV